MSRRGSRFSGSEDESDINLTPMLDVVFIMLIFFIVTATFIKQGQNKSPPLAYWSLSMKTVTFGLTKNVSIRLRYARTLNVCTRKTPKAVWWCKLTKVRSTKN